MELNFDNTNPQSASAFFKLPMELKLAIYDLVLPTGRVKIQPVAYSRVNMPSIMLCCKRMRIEAEGLFWSKSLAIYPLYYVSTVTKKGEARLRLEVLQRCASKIRKLQVLICMAPEFGRWEADNLSIMADTVEALDCGAGLTTFSIAFLGFTLNGQIKGGGFLRVIRKWKKMNVDGEVNVGPIIQRFSHTGQGWERDLYHELAGAISGLMIDRH
jgi:hypothetical protein